MITYKEFIKKYEGKYIDYDGYAGVQCVDFAKLYLKECFGIECGTMGKAKEWWEKRFTNPIIRENFDFVTVNSHRPYSTTKIRQGDIGIRDSGKYGHIFVCDSVSGPSITYYDENGTGRNDKVTKRNKPYTNYYVTGLLRKKTTKMKVTAKTGLHYYNHINSEVAGTIPYSETIKVIVKNAGTKKVDGTNYKMAIVIYNNNQVYVAQKYLK